MRKLIRSSMFSKTVYILDVCAFFLMGIFEFFDSLIFRATYLRRHFSSGIILNTRISKEGQVTSFSITRNQTVFKRLDSNDTLSNISILFNSTEWIKIIKFLECHESLLPLKWRFVSSLNRLLYYDEAAYFSISIDDLEKIRNFLEIDNSLRNLL